MTVSTSRAARQQRIVEILASTPVRSQTELLDHLAEDGIEVTQATLSRDIHELGLIKTSEGYSLPGNGSEPPLPPVVRLVREFVREVRRAQNQVILKTSPGSAQPVAAALDSAHWPELLGTVAGDDTILIITPDKKHANKLADRVTGMLA
jgi:transcriptional regulator of arginine metabolism